jgi:hypothetical protein
MTKYEKIMALEKYKNNLRIDGDKVISYVTHVATIREKNKTLEILGKWSQTTTKHINYVAKELNLTKQYI